MGKYTEKDFNEMLKEENRRAANSKFHLSSLYGNFGGANPDLFTLYQHLVKRTMNTDLNDLEQCKNYLLGLSGETGELINVFKKAFYHASMDMHDIKSGIDRYKALESIVDELGDVLWYYAALANLLDINLSIILMNNIDKLQNRYPDGFRKGVNI